MAIKTLIKPSEYHDSVSLMLVARQLAQTPGVVDAAVVMATEANKAILQAANLLTNQAQSAGPNDLVIAVSAPEELLDGYLAEAERLLRTRQEAQSEKGGGFRPRTLRGAVKAAPGANLVVISIAGRFAAAEAWQALHLGLHVLLFSDNVSLEDEVALKHYAVEHGLLMMGPGAGTAILNGAALGFANQLPAGPVGIVSAAGTGLQEVSCLLARAGVGLTQGIGTGGRDVKAEVGGMMMLAGLQALQVDPATQVIALVGKPPDPRVADQVLAQAAVSTKPTVLCFLGADLAATNDRPNIYAAHTLQECAWLAARLAQGEPVTGLEAMLAEEDRHLAEQATALKAGLGPKQKYLRGLFSGGTLCFEAQVIWRDRLAEPVLSNAPLRAEDRLPLATLSQGHCAVDLGEEEFTVGRPHPMIDNDLRIRRLLQEAQDPQAAVLMVDVVIGYGAHPDPAAELGPAVRQARQVARAAGRQLPVVASVTGSPDDPQGLLRQIATLEEAGCLVCTSNAAAARLVAHIVSA